jgi:periplasmic divalent cation tolerance protein
LLEKKLIACANIIPGMTSVYQWQGKIEEEKELVIIFKTTDEMSKKCMETIEKLHPYDTPCVLKINSAECNKDYLSWAYSQTCDS